MRKYPGMLHLIPFDLGVTFYDPIELRNKKNLELADKFVNALKENYPNGAIEKNINLKKQSGEIIGYKFENNNLGDIICRIQFNDFLQAVILLNGIGIFILLDPHCDNAKKAYGDIEHIVFALNYYKVNTQNDLLNGTNIYEDTRKNIHEFMNLCWKLISRLRKQLKVRYVRCFSSNSNYKYNGLSYILTSYIFSDENRLSEKEMKYLMYAPFSGKDQKISFNVAREKINIFNIEKTNKIDGNKGQLWFSWSAVATVVNDEINSINEIYMFTDFMLLIKQEFYVQSRWYIADNSIDNALKSFNNKTLGLRRIEGLIEHYDSEINNQTSANMSTAEKEILKKLITTSEIKSVYASAKRQIQLQRKLNEDHDNDVRKRSSLILSIFMAIFTASSLYSTIYDILEQSKNLSIFISMLVIAIVAVLMDYLNK